ITGHDGTGVGAADNVVRFSKCPGADYSTALKNNFDTASPELEQAFLDRLDSANTVRVVASPRIATSIARVDGKPHVFFSNFAGLRGRVNPIQTPQTGTKVVMTGVRKGRGFFLPFLGDV